MNFSPVEIWLIIGIICIVMEFSTIPGIGFLFIGLGSFSNAILINIIPGPWEYQVIFLALFSLLWFTILWWPLKKYVYNTGEKKDHFSMIGSEVVVFSQVIEPDGSGQVKWSGAVMNAKLSYHDEQKAVAGQKLYIISVEGNVLTCSNTKPVRKENR
jgi:membrane protein implicated in regulation of membrane protease activity